MSRCAAAWLAAAAVVGASRGAPAGERPHLAVPASAEAAQAMRQAFDREVFAPNLARLRATYAVEVRDAVLAGVPVHIVTPRAGVPKRNRRRVLIALHSGAFLVGSGPAAIGLAVPLAALGRIEVVAVDYRLAPEAPFPAAVDDAAAVYQALAAARPSAAIGVYGCSAGGLLTAELVARLQAQGAALPGAVGVLCAGDFGLAAGLPPAHDAVHLAYGPQARDDDPLFAALDAPQVLAKLPPTLIVTSRGGAEYPAVLRLRKALDRAGVAVEFRAWGELPHAFFDPYGDPGAPQAHAAQAAIAEFFDRRLAR
jgi:monoterpene epsilon-lactone hydrolase